MKPQGYHRFGLLQNPFAELQSDALEDAGMLHVEAGEDDALRALREDVLDGRRKAFVLVVGPMGAGKTHRLKVLHDAFVDAGGTAVLHNVTVQSGWTVASIAQSLLASLPRKGMQRILTPKWHTQLTKLVKKGPDRLDPQQAGVWLAEALAAHAPAALLLNDMQSLEGEEEAKRMLQVLYSMQNAARPGTMVVLTSYPKYAKALWSLHPAFAGRIDRVAVLRGLDRHEARLLVAKRLAMYRMVEDLAPLYPFTEDAVDRMIGVAAGNPRELLRLAHKVLENAASSRAFHVDESLVQGVVAPLAAVGPDTQGRVARPVRTKPPAGQAAPSVPVS